MTDDTAKPVDIDDDNLDAFEQKFYNLEPEVAPEVEEVKEPEVEDAEEEVDETEDDSLAPEDDEAETESEEDDEEEEVEETPPPKKNRKNAKERIEELVAKQHETERSARQREAELMKRLEQLEAQIVKETEQKTVPLREVLPDDAPHPDQLDDKGEPLYPLGEFDPLYITDLTKFTIERETKAAKEREATERQIADMEKAKKEISDAWIERVEAAEERIPDLRENMVTLTNTFADLDPNYGEYLASTIMLSEVGPEIMDYLSQNIGEAQRIVASGPHAATLALGRLEAMFSTPSTEKPEKKRNTKQVSKAPAPPEESTKGRGSSTAVAPDTDNLDAFEKVFYQK